MFDDLFVNSMMSNEPVQMKQKIWHSGKVYSLQQTF
jgi:hypothetical protein